MNGNFETGVIARWGTTLILVLAVMCICAPRADAQVGAVSGRVSESAGGAGIQGVSVRLYTSLGILVASGVSTADGSYTIPAAPGIYFARTGVSVGSPYIDRLHAGALCIQNCAAATGTAITVTSGTTSTGIDFALDRSGAIAGSVTADGTSLPLAGVTVAAYTAGGKFVASSMTAGNGTFTISGLPAGSYFTSTGDLQQLNYLRKVYGNVPCAANCPITSGTPIGVAPGMTTNAIDFALAAGGSIAGVVTDGVTDTPINNVTMSAYTALGVFQKQTQTSGSGSYVLGGLAAGSYFVRAGPQGAASYVSEFHDNARCTAICNPSIGTPVAVSVGTIHGGIDFELGPGGSIAGVVTDAVTSAPLEGIFVEVFNQTGAAVRSVPTNPAGAYATGPLSPGVYFARTSQGAGQPYLKELYNNVSCPADCLVTTGTPIVVSDGQIHAGVDFTVSSGGQVTGTVTDSAASTPLANVPISIFTPAGTFVANGFSNAAGVYLVEGLPAGPYFAKASSAPPYADELYNGLPCIANCDVTAGAPFVVTVGGVKSGVNFSLTTGGVITGTVTNATTGAPIPGTVMRVYSSAGTFVRSATTSGSGVYSVGGLSTGSYLVGTTVSSTLYVDEVYSNVTCGAGCAVTAGSPVSVTVGTTRTGVDFALAPGGGIAGTVTDASTGSPLAGLTVQAFRSAGGLVQVATTNNGGTYSIAGLPTGSYVVRTAVPGAANYIDEAYNNLPCAGCPANSGTSVQVTAGATTAGIHFALSAGASITGNLFGQATGHALNGGTVGIYTEDGTLVKSAKANSAGAYAVMGLPTGTFFAKTLDAASYGLVSEVFDDIPCPLSCSPAGGTALTVAAGTVRPGVDFALATGGTIIGRITDAGTATGLAGVGVGLYDSSAAIVGTTTTGLGGHFVLTGMGDGTYYARTFSSGRYLDELYSGLTLCQPSCLMTSGTPILVTAGNTTSDVDFTLAASVELIRNGDFSFGPANWLVFATPTPSYMAWQFDTGTFWFRRLAPPPGTANQAVVFQQTGRAVAGGAPLIVQFDVGNTSSARKRISVLVHDGDFSDLSVCTFWLPANLPLTRYGMRTRSTKAWTNATISFYAASTSAPAGDYQLDNVSLQSPPLASIDRTDCLDPFATLSSGGPASGNLLVNGNFDSGTVGPGWATFGQISGQVSTGVFEFVKNAGAPSGVLLQATGQDLPAGDVLTAAFDLGNSSAVRKRVTAILHDGDFSDLSACTFWLEPGQPMSTYTYGARTTKPWADATFSIYPATVGAAPWIRLDNVTLQRTPSAAITGTECVEPGAADMLTASADAVAIPGAGFAHVPEALANTRAAAGATQQLSLLEVQRQDFSSDEDWISDGFRTQPSSVVAGRESAWLAAADTLRSHTLQRREPVDLVEATFATLHMRSRLTASDSKALVQVSLDEIDWYTVHAVAASDAWIPIEIDLAAWLGSTLHIRFVFDAVPDDPALPDRWWLAAIAIDIGPAFLADGLPVPSPTTLEATQP